MKTTDVEIYSDATNAAVMRHPGRHFPGLLVQGDTLNSLCAIADDVCRSIGRRQPGYDEANELRNRLQGMLTHYKKVLLDANMKLPFSDR
jgi:hypothetical protein